MFTFLRAQTASVTATLADFLVTILLVRFFGCWYVAASALGTLTGGGTHFLMGRHWVFHAAEGKMQAQALKYLLVWSVYLLVSTGLVFLITSYGGLYYVLSKIMVAVTMSVTYNYFLHKKFVFR